MYLYLKTIRIIKELQGIIWKSMKIGTKWNLLKQSHPNLLYLLQNISSIILAIIISPMWLIPSKHLALQPSHPSGLVSPTKYAAWISSIRYDRKDVIHDRRPALNSMWERYSHLLRATPESLRPHIRLYHTIVPCICCGSWVGPCSCGDWQGELIGHWREGGS